MQMRFKNILTLLTLSTALIAVSCKDEEKDTTSLSFTGSIKITLPEYMEKGSVVTFDLDTLVSLSRDDEQGSDVGYYVSNPTTGSRDTIYYDGHILNVDYPDAVYTFTAPEDLKSATLMIVGFSEGYYERSGSAAFVTVDPRLDGTGSITGFSQIPGQGIFVDPRDAARYYTVKIGDVEWMRNNLSWKGSGVSYRNSPAMDKIFGRFYTWDEARTACPEGWRLPDEKDWEALALSFGGSVDKETGNLNDAAAEIMEEISFNGTELWEYWPAVKIDNRSGLSVFPTGYATRSTYGFEFKNDNYYAMFWTADLEQDGSATYRYVCEDKDIIFHGCADGSSFALNVRCVR